MADFAKAYDAVVAGHEGGYVNDPDDPGGETWRGVARRRNPDWPGWPLVDKLKGAGKGALASSAELQVHVHALYKSNYWDVFYGDHMPWQEVANELFDSQVNTGRGIQFAQQALNKLNGNGARWADVIADNRFGPKTFAAMKQCCGDNRRGTALLVKLQNLAQARHYWAIMDRAHDQEKFVGWWART